MSFSDEDLLILKHWLVTEKRPVADEIIKDLKALLTRLEAAEKVISLGQTRLKERELNEALDIWRKASGKAGDSAESGAGK